MLDMMFVGDLRITIAADRKTVTIEADGTPVARFGQIGQLSCDAAFGIITDLRGAIEQAMSEAESAAHEAEAAGDSLRELLRALDKHEPRAA